MKRIVALDPGGTTGWAMWEDKHEGRRELDVNEFIVGQMAGDHHQELYEFLETQQTSDFTIVCESFEFRQRLEDAARMNINLMSKEYIGVTRLFGQVRNVPVVLQTAALGKGFIPDKPKNGLGANAKLKIMGLYFPSHKHANDAMRHLIYYMVNGPMHRVDLIKSWRDL